MDEDPVGSLLCRLYELCQGKADDKGGNRVVEGHRFEDETSEQIYHFAREAGLDPNPPRTTLMLPTLSGNVHQFDGCLRSGENIFAVECKNTREAAKDYLYYFNAKLMDYTQSPRFPKSSHLRGIFVSTVSVAESAWRYGLAYGIRIVDPVSPPPEYMLSDARDDALRVGLEQLLTKIVEMRNGEEQPGGAPRLLEEYRYFCGRYRDG
jgi:hypothetical protein